MAWTAPRTWTTGETVTATLLNTHLRDNLLATCVATVTTAGDMTYASAANAIARLAIGANKTGLMSNGSVPAWTASPDWSGSGTFEAGLNVGSATGAGTGVIKASGAILSATRLHPGTLNGPSTGLQAGPNVQLAYFNNTAGGLAGNTSTTIASFPIGRFHILNASTGDVGAFDSNSVSTVTDRGSAASIQISGADPGASSSKIWITLATGTLTIFNRYAAAQTLTLIGFGNS